jgi:selenide, water dikinase
MDVMAQAGCTVIGGHSIDGPEPTYGFAVTGLASPVAIMTNSGARPDEALILTKPLGIGIITTAIKHGLCPDAVIDRVVEVMVMLNEQAAAAARDHRASAVTDVTGFGLLGHLREMCRASGTGAQVHFGTVPVLDGAAELLERRMWAGGSQRNLISLEDEVISQVTPEQLKILVDAQTSGGLLISISPEALAGYLHDVPGSAHIGKMTADGGIAVLA